MTRTRSASLAVLVVLAVAAGGCGIPADDGPRAITDDGAPDDLDAEVDVGGGESAVVDLYFTRFDDERDVLAAVPREVPTAGSSVPAPAAVLETLFAGPTPADTTAHGAATKIPDGTALSSPPELTGGVLTVDLNDASSGVQNEGAWLAFGQMVCTADGLTGVDGVRFTREGERLDAPNGDGEASPGVLTCADYAALGGTRAGDQGAGSPTSAED
jgi:spore germination protein GerM